MNYEEVKSEATAVASELVEKASLKEGDILVIGCSSSEVRGIHIGRGSDLDVARAIYEGIISVTEDRGIFLAAQCCEHLNRAIVMERAAVKPWEEIVNAVPQIHAGGSFATTVYNNAKEPVVLETVSADAGIDIGGTLIGMHLRHVAVPVRIATRKIGEASVVCARTRPKYIGGERANYDLGLSGGEVRKL